MDKILCKHYLKITFTNVSPLSIGSGEGEKTDKDIVRNSWNVPYIPGTTLAGIYRSLFDNDGAKLYFGPEIDGRRGAQNEAKDSQLLIYNAELENKETVNVVSRDMVALTKYKTAQTGAKFDFEALEAGGKFISYIEWNQTEKGESPFDVIVGAWDQDRVVIGGKTGRGYGCLQKIDIKYKKFSFGNEEELQNWLKFDMYTETSWEDFTKADTIDHRAGKAEMQIKIRLKQKGGIAIRKYSTSTGEADYEQLTSKIGNKVMPVIPGTSWAGAFRSQIQKLDPSWENSEKLEYFFGKAKPEDQESGGWKTKIRFAESKIDGATAVNVTRNAIDRFTNATVTGALYTERTYYNGKTTLDITIEETYSEKTKTNIEDNKEGLDEIGFQQVPVEPFRLNEFYRVLAAAIADLHEGYMAVGGLTAVGRGLFDVKEVKIRPSSAGDWISIEVGKDGATLYKNLVGQLVKNETREGDENEQ